MEWILTQQYFDGIINFKEYNKELKRLAKELNNR